MRQNFFKLINIFQSVLLGISLFSIKIRVNRVISVIATCSVLLIPVMLKEKISGFSVHQKWMLFCASPALIQLIEYLVTGDALCLVVFLLLGIVFVFEWKSKVISDRWKP